MEYMVPFYWKRSRALHTLAYNFVAMSFFLISVMLLIPASASSYADNPVFWKLYILIPAVTHSSLFLLTHLAIALSGKNLGLFDQDEELWAYWHALPRREQKSLRPTAKKVYRSAQKHDVGPAYRFEKLIRNLAKEYQFDSEEEVLTQLDMLEARVKTLQEDRRLIEEHRDNIQKIVEELS